MSRENDIERLANELGYHFDETRRELLHVAEKLVDAGFGHIGDEKVKQLSLEKIHKLQIDRLEKSLGHMRELLDTKESLRATIADLEKRLENSVEMPKPERWPEWADRVIVLFSKRPDGNGLGGKITWDGPKEAYFCEVSRPTPAKLTPEQMAEEWLDWAQDQPNMAKLFADAIDQGKSIEELYKESINGR